MASSRNGSIFLLLLFVTIAVQEGIAFMAINPVNNHRQQSSFSRSVSQRQHGIRQSPLHATTTSTSAPQILQFQEPTTNVTVVLVGAMHYNPTSIQTAFDTVNSLGMKNQLGSVIVEQCDIRWNKTNELLEKNPALQPIVSKFLQNEMRTAAEAAIEYRRPVILGDQRINLTSIALKETLKATVTDLVIPVTGWKRFYQDVRDNFEKAVPLGSYSNQDGKEIPYLNVFSFLDARLWIAAPISFVKYPLSFLVRNPITTSIFFTILYLLNSAIDASISSTATASVGSLEIGPVNAEDLALSIGLSFLETFLFARLLLGPMLAERNEVLARNILEQCKLYSSNGKQTQSLNGNNNKNWFSQFFSGPKQETQAPKQQTMDEDFEIVYAPEMIQAGIPASTRSSKDDNDKTVVAILGMAHCNGIMKLLLEQKV